MKERLHTADHILSDILEKRFKAKTKGLDFREDNARLSLDCEMDLREIKDEVEKEVNSIIDQSLEVKSYTLPREEAEKVVKLSFVPESIKDIKIYEIVGFNKLACGGPHVNNTKEIGKFKIVKIKKYGKDRYSLVYTVE